MASGSATISGAAKRPLSTESADSADEDDNAAESCACADEDRGNPLELLASIFADCDRAYIESRLAWHRKKHDVLCVVSEELMQRKYPKAKERASREQIAARKLQLESAHFTPPEFLRLYRRPEDVFKSTTSHVTPEYKAHAVIGLRNDFRRIKCSAIQDTLRQYGFHYTPAYDRLKDIATQIAERKLSGDNWTRQTTRKLERFPSEPCELFYHERWFVRNQDAIIDYLQEHEERLSAAVSAGDALVCDVCLADVLVEEFVWCLDGKHGFCAECVISAAEVGIEKGNWKVDCLDSDCKSEFSTRTVEARLSPPLCTLLERRRAEHEIRLVAADIDEQLVTCPECPYAAIVSDADDRVFRCLNPDCLRETCRLCGEPSHIPQRCNEIERSGETMMRSFIERAMTEAMLRTCWKCSRRFFKTQGCNVMRCICGASMCYICRRANCYTCSIGEADMDALHISEMKKAGEEARLEFIRLHPQYADLQLTNDPLNLIDTSAVRDPTQVERFFGNLARILFLPLTALVRLTHP